MFYKRIVINECKSYRENEKPSERKKKMKMKKEIMLRCITLKHAMGN